MKFNPPLTKAIIHKRYKRFLSDIELASGEMVCAHVPNTGSMTSCWEKGWTVYISKSDNPKRKLKYTLEMTSNGDSLICVNTSMTNKLVLEALQAKKITELVAYDEIKPEQKIFDSRLDFKLSGENLPDAYVEVKNVTLLTQKELAEFPDAVTTRGQKHLTDLIKIKEQGDRAIMLYIVNRADATSFAPAQSIDPVYCELVNQAKAAGVEILCYQSQLTPDEIKISHPLPVQL